MLLKEFGPIDYIDFSPIEPYHFAVTCSVRVCIFYSLMLVLVSVSDIVLINTCKYWWRFFKFDSSAWRCDTFFFFCAGASVQSHYQNSLEECIQVQGSSIWWHISI